MYDTISAAEQREVMQTLRDLGVLTAAVEFSGGNDEGGADGIDYLDADGNAVTVPNGNAYENQEWNSKTRSYGPSTWIVWDRSLDGNQRPATDEEVKWSKIGKVLEFPIFDRWGSFAGDFYVQGTCTWDVAKGTYALHGQEEIREWQDF